MSFCLEFPHFCKQQFMEWNTKHNDILSHLETLPLTITRERERCGAISSGILHSTPFQSRLILYQTVKSNSALQLNIMLLFYLLNLAQQILFLLSAIYPQAVTGDCASEMLNCCGQPVLCCTILKGYNPLLFRKRCVNPGSFVHVLRLGLIHWAICDVFSRERQPPSVWSHEYSPNAVCSPDWDFCGAAGSLGSANPSSECRCLLCKFLHRGNWEAILFPADIGKAFLS